MKIKTIQIKTEKGAYIDCCREGETKKDIKKFLKQIHGEKISYKDLNLVFRYRKGERELFEDGFCQKNMWRENDALAITTLYKYEPALDEIFSMLWVLSTKDNKWHWVL